MSYAAGWCSSAHEHLQKERLQLNKLFDMGIRHRGSIAVTYTTQADLSTNFDKLQRRDKITNSILRYQDCQMFSQYSEQNQSPNTSS